MTSPTDAIRARRKLTNKLIAGHEAARLRPFFASDVTLIVGDGSLILGADAVIAAFAAQFADPGFKTFVRTTQSVEVDEAGERGAETGRWAAISAGPEVAGSYMATWRKVHGQWVIENELYVTLKG